MGKKYYCDFCQNTFKDNLVIRKNHLDGLKHKITRNDYYAKFRAPRIILQEETVKSPCIRAMNNQECKFGSLCRFSHYSPNQIWQLQQKVQHEDYQKWLRSLSDKIDDPTLENFLEKRAESLLKSIVECKKLWDYPDELLDAPNLPPSLRKLNINEIPDNFEEWG